MTTNSYINNYKKSSEQDLLDDLIIESIKMHGYDMIYLPRIKRKLDLIYGEDVLSKFSDNYEMEMYIKSVDAYGGDGNFMSKFGLEIRDRATLVVSIRRFDCVTNGEIQRPNEGDLLYFAMDKKLFEIKYVENRSVFFQLGQLYVYELTVEPYQFSHEEFNTGLEEVDSMTDKYQSSQLLELDSFTGLFNKGDTVYQGASLPTATATGVVLGFDETDKTLILKKVTGEFIAANGTITGAVGTAELSITDELIPQTYNDTSKEIKSEADAVIEFSEDNPFSEDL